MNKLIKSKIEKQMGVLGFVDLEVRKYDRKVFFNNLWNQDPDLVKSRGAVFVDDKQVVFPMDKCFNYGENGAGKNLGLDTPVVAYKKLNGYMLNLTYSIGIGWIVSTTGSAYILNYRNDDILIKNKFLAMGVDFIEMYNGMGIYREIMKKVHAMIDKEFELTLTFEVCHPDDKHIVDEEIGLHPICYQFNGVTYPIENNAVTKHETTLGKILEDVKWVKHEGFMVYNLNGELCFKLKSPYYLAKKWVQRGSEKRIWDQDYKQRLDEEYYPIVKYIRANVTKYGWSILSEDEKSQHFIDAYNYTNSGVSHG